jgi:L-amino acid N-acyltransferase YncA
VLIRPANAQDWRGIWPFFTQICAAGETYAYPDSPTPDQGRALWMEPPPGQTVVALDGGAVVGPAKMGPNRPGRGAHIATASFMVDPAGHGRGVGRALVNYAIDWSTRAGYHGMQFNAVVETNRSAVHLWRSVGFTIVGTVPDAFDHPRHGLVGLHVMYRRL